jgi:hypothetical protein
MANWILEKMITSDIERLVGIKLVLRTESQNVKTKKKGYKSEMRKCIFDKIEKIGNH